MTTKIVDGNGCATMKSESLARTTADANARLDAARKVCAKGNGNVQTVNADVVTLSREYTKTGKKICVKITASVTCRDEFTAEPTPAESLKSTVQGK